MQKNYGKNYARNYLKIYFWQTLSLILNFISMLIVLPYLTSDPVIYGIYTVCISFSIFLSYADLGFMGAGQKYAAEYYVQNNRNEEIKIIGFVSFILLIFLVLFSIGFFILSIKPEMLIKGLNTEKQHNIASSLLLILAIFTPTTLFQRLLQIIFGIRMEDFYIQRISIIGNICKILSVLYFFRSGNYDIVGYFLFTQVVNLLASVITLIIAQKKYKYNFSFFFRSIRFNKSIYNKTKSLAFASLFMTISWILYYELDSVAIGKFLGANQVAVYAIGLTLLTFFRSILGILFSPLSIRFNHFIGNRDETGLKSLYLKVISIFAPLVVFPIISILLLAKPIVYSWIGNSYSESITIVQLLVCCNIFAFISYPTSFMLIAREKQKALYLISMLLPFVFWLGIVVTINTLGIKSFALFKLISFLLIAIVYYKLMLEYLNINLKNSVKRIFLPMLLPIFVLIILLLIIQNYLPREKSKTNLITIAIIMSILLVISFVIQYFTSKAWKLELNKTIKLFKK